MSQSPIDELEYQRRVQRLASHWGVSEAAILKYGANFDIRNESWEYVFKGLTKKITYTASVQTRQVGRGYLGSEHAPGESQIPTDTMIISLAGPVEPTARYLKSLEQRAELRDKAEKFLSKVLQREIKITFF